MMKISYCNTYSSFHFPKEKSKEGRKEGREGGREGGREEGREGGREEGRKERGKGKYICFKTKIQTYII